MTLSSSNFLDKHIALDDVIKQIRDLPTLPEVARDMLSNINDENLSLDAICEKVSQDQSLVAKMIRLANSSIYGSNSKVVTLQQAVVMLGIKNVKNLIRMTLMTHSFPATLCPGFDFKAFWRHSVATAICAELISRTLHMKHDFAFTAGLLHDIGKLVLATRFPEEYAQVICYQLEHDCHLIEAEQAVLGIDHIAAGLILAIHWQFSDVIQDAIRGHHQPDGKNLNAVADIVHVANAIVHALDLSQTENDLVPLLSKAAWDTLALTESDYLSIFRETELRFAAIDQVLL
jgi:putative nucleotidyltransferase with HDIG domain